MLLYRLLYIVRETWGECKNPWGWGRGGRGVLWGVWVDYQTLSGEPEVYIFVCCLVLQFQNCTFSVFTFINPLLLLSANRSSDKSSGTAKGTAQRQTFSAGWGALPYKRLMGMCRQIRLHFHSWIDYNEVAFLRELLEGGRTSSGFGGKTVLHIYGQQTYQNVCTVVEK